MTKNNLKVVKSDSKKDQDIKREIDICGIKGIVPVLEGNAWITGEQKLYLDNKNPFPQGYRLTDTWPKI